MTLYRTRIQIQSKNFHAVTTLPIASYLWSKSIAENPKCSHLLFHFLDYKIKMRSTTVSIYFLEMKSIELGPNLNFNNKEKMMQSTVPYRIIKTFSSAGWMDGWMLLCNGLHFNRWYDIVMQINKNDFCFLMHYTTGWRTIQDQDSCNFDQQLITILAKLFYLKINKTSAN